MLRQIGLLTAEHKKVIGETGSSVSIEVSRRDIQKYAAATEQQLEKCLAADEVPPMIVFNLFARIVGPMGYKLMGCHRVSDYPKDLNFR